jgi:hypothetical protein
MEATGTLQSRRADGCQATKEDLIRDKLKSFDFCPICLEDYNIRCRVVNHPRETGYLILFNIVPHSKFCIICIFVFCNYEYLILLNSHTILNHLLIF